MPTSENPPESGSAPDSRGDAELLRNFVAHRDAAAMTAIVDRHGPLVLGLCRSILRNEQDAADAFQTVFLVLLKNASSIGKPASLASWLFGVAYRVAVRAKSQAAQRRRHESAGAAMTSSVPAAAAQAADEETLLLIHRELADLPERLRLPLILCGLQGKSRDEAAQELGWTAGSVKGRLERGRALLEARLAKRGVVLPSAVLTGLMLQQATVPVPAGLVASTVKAVLLVAAGKTVLGGIVSANVVALTQGVLISMKIAKLKMTALVAAALLFVGGSSVVIVYTAKEMLAARRPLAVVESSAADPATYNLTVAREMPVYSTPIVVDPGDPVRRLASRNLRQLGLAMHKYHDQHGSFPFPATRAADGTPLLSWRVALLPYLDEAALYSQFRHDEPWDSPHNLALLDRMPAVFDSAAANGKQPGETFFQVFVGPQAIFENDGATRSVAQILDGTSNTFLIVDGATAVPWTKPVDLPYVPNQPLPKLGGIVPDGFLAVFADGSSASYQGEVLDSGLRAMITAVGGEIIGR